MIAEVIDAAIARLPERATVVLACSGGVDSTVLARVAVPRLQASGRTPILAHLDHGLRPDAVRDGAFVSRLAAELGVACVRRRRRPRTDRIAAVGLQAAAREVRYDFFDRVLDGFDAPTLWLAHHEDDQLETILLRGRAMPAVRGRFARPLLAVARSAICALARSSGWSWRVDPSNRDPRFARTAARAEVQALDSAGRTALLASASPSVRPTPAPARPAPPSIAMRSLPADRAEALLRRCRGVAGRRFALVDRRVGPLRIGRVGAGRRIRPFGLAGSRLLRDLLSEAGVPAAVRADWPTVETAAGEVLWLPGVRASEAAVLRSDSTHATLLYTVAPLNRGVPRFDS